MERKVVEYGTFEIQFDMEGDAFFQTDEREVNYLSEFIRLDDGRAVRSSTNSSSDVIELSEDGSEVHYYLEYYTWVWKGQCPFSILIINNYKMNGLEEFIQIQKIDAYWDNYYDLLEERYEDLVDNYNEDSLF